MPLNLDFTSEGAIAWTWAAAAAKAKRVRNTQRRERKKRCRGNTVLFGALLDRPEVDGAEVEVLGGHGTP